ncbi:major facilitator superfamily domain-containing protein [Bisporella sp. PMI_857]|nr:major facilitator superfamily domain-containing protein [Bisporella sp. PMI_857]
MIDENGHIRKIPVPSNDPTDPLTWSSWRRCLILFSLCLFGTAGFGVVQSTPLFFSDIIPEYKKETRGVFDAAKISQLASYPSLCMGLGNFLFVPLSMWWGRRAIFLFNNMLMLAAIFWAARSDGFTSHLASRCLQGLSCGVSDCLLPIMILDMTFLHRRGLWMSFYWASTAAGSTALLVAVPFVVQGTTSNWRTNYWFWSGFSAFSLILGIFLLPETIFARAPALIDGQLILTDHFGNVTVATAEEAVGVNPTASGQEREATVQTSRSKTLINSLSPIHLQRHGFERFITTYAEMTLSLLNPSIVYILILNSLLFGGLVSLSITYAQVLEFPPWHFSAAAVGTANVGSCIGALLALLLSGSTVDTLSGMLTRRNGGVREPEHILPNILPPALLAFVGMVVYGCVAGNPESHTGHGWIGIHVSFGLYYCAFVAISAISSMWIGEATPHWSGAALVLVCGGRNVLSFAISNNFTNWIASQGFQNAYIELGSVLLAVIIVGGVPIYFFNKKVRGTWGRKLSRLLKRV